MKYGTPFLYTSQYTFDDFCTKNVISIWIKLVFKLFEFIFSFSLYMKGHADTIATTRAYVINIAQQSIYPYMYNRSLAAPCETQTFTHLINKTP